MLLAEKKHMATVKDSNEKTVFTGRAAGTNKAKMRTSTCVSVREGARLGEICVIVSGVQAYCGTDG